MNIELLMNSVGVVVSVVLVCVCIAIHIANARLIKLLEALHRERFNSERRLTTIEHLVERLTEGELELKDEQEALYGKIELIAPTLK